MTATSRTRLDPAQLAEAWDWVLRLQDEAVSQEDLAEWLRWYEADDRHKAAFDDMQSFWQQIDRVTDDPNPLPADLWLGGLAVSKADASQLLAPEPRESVVRRMKRFFDGLIPSRRSLSFGGMAVALSLCVLLAARVLQTPAPQGLQAAGPVLSPVAQVTTLQDGSRVELAPKSSVAVQYTERQRVLDMAGGEAFFTVAHNRERPFIVRVGKLRVRAVGTAFNVRSAGDRVVVTVAEGTVDVYPAPAAAGAEAAPDHPPGAVRVTAGSQVQWTPSGPVIAMVDPAHAVAWRQGRLEYLNEPLASAIADINRYSAHPIVIRDPAVGKIVFSGTVLAEAADAWVQALPSLFPIDLQNDAGGNVVLVSRARKDGAARDAAR